MARRRTAAVGPLGRSRPPPCHCEHRRRRRRGSEISRSYWERRRGGGKTREYERAPEMTASPVAAAAAVIISIIQPFLRPAAPPETRGRCGAWIERTSVERKGRRETGAINEDGRGRQGEAGGAGADGSLRARWEQEREGAATGAGGERGTRAFGLNRIANCRAHRRSDATTHSLSPFLRRSVLSCGGRGRREPGEEGRERHRQGKLHRLQTPTARGTR